MSIEITNKMAALLPCPFCGGDVEVRRASSSDGADWIRHVGAPCFVEVSDFGYDEPVEVLWNRRAALSPAPQALAGEAETQTTVGIGRDGKIFWTRQGDMRAHAREQAERIERLEAGQTAAARDVLAERRRQVEVEGWTPEHDDQHDQSEMARVAACYAIADTPADEAVYVHGRWRDACDLYWPRLWGSDWWRPTDRRRNLVKAGALILAEIERLDRAALAEGEGQADG